MSDDELDAASLADLTASIDEAMERRSSAPASRTTSRASNRDHLHPLHNVNLPLHIKECDEFTLPQPYRPSRQIPLSPHPTEQTRGQDASSDVTPDKPKPQESGTYVTAHRTFLRMLSGALRPSDSSSLCMNLLIIMTIFVFAIVAFMGIKGSIIDIKNSHTFNFPESTIPSSLPSVIRHVDSWGPALEVAANDLRQLGEQAKDTNQAQLPTKEARKLQNFNAEFEAQLAKSLGQGRDDIRWLINEIKENPISDACWGEDHGSWWFLDQFWIDPCKERLSQQHKVLLGTFQEAHKS
ncbi:Ff.00g065700.m01.CDS01 [Fusarium sp. VM40]|nr:Ff.00g065700.m01.CDS01 [Fusarium sp. VM40]